MHTNTSTLDRGVRTLIAAAALGAAIVIGVASIGGIVLLILTALMAVTAAVGFCPLYALFHLDSHGRRPLPH
jgi:hypothetical protein